MAATILNRIAENGSFRVEGWDTLSDGTVAVSTGLFTVHTFVVTWKEDPGAEGIPVRWSATRGVVTVTAGNIHGKTFSFVATGLL